jgi:uncharacterized membrane protein YcgQ (UPF0703/DUF1980 family)
VKVPVKRGEAPEEESWVQVEGTLDLDRSPPPDESLDPPVLAATAVRATDEPDEIYEYP